MGNNQLSNRVLLIGLLGLTTLTAQAQICQQEKPLPVDHQRFVVQGGDTVLDKKLKLQWQR